MGNGIMSNCQYNKGGYALFTQFTCVDAHGFDSSTEIDEMNQTARNRNEKKVPVTLINAKERFYVCQYMLREMELEMMDIKDSDHPGIMDLMLQYSMLRTSASRIGKRLQGQKDAKISLRDTKMIQSFEILVHEFRDTLTDAHVELT